MPPHWVGFLRLFGLKTGIDFAHFGLEWGMVFEGTTGVYEGICRCNSKWVRKKEKYMNSKWIWRIFFVCALILVIMTQFLPKDQVWKRVWILEVWSENGRGKWRFLVWNRVRIWRTRRHTPTKNSQEYPPRGVSPAEISVRGELRELFSLLLKRPSRGRFVSLERFSFVFRA